MLHHSLCLVRAAVSRACHATCMLYACVLALTMTGTGLQAFVYVLAEWEGSKHKVNQVVLWKHIIDSQKEAQLDLQETQLDYPFALTEYGTPAPHPIRQPHQQQMCARVPEPGAGPPKLDRSG